MWTTPRSVEPEWLDDLPANDMRALRSRHELRRVNGWMLQSAIMAHALRKHCGSDAPRTVLDLGGGDGTFMLRVARRLAPHWRKVALITVDRQSIVTAQTRKSFRALNWSVESVAADVLEFLQSANVPLMDVITANLLLHHFQDEPLTRLLTGVARRTRRFVACEPRRNPSAMLASRMLWALGCGEVTRHDAVVSVRAGFNGSELSKFWLKQAQWELDERSLMFTHRFAACRRNGITR